MDKQTAMILSFNNGDQGVDTIAKNGVAADDIDALEVCRILMIPMVRFAQFVRTEASLLCVITVEDSGSMMGTISERA